MRRFSVLSALWLLIALSSLAQESANLIRVGVAVMENNAGRSVPGTVERDHLVKAMNQLKPDNKTHVKVQAVPLQSTSGEEAQAEAQQQNCQYIVFTRLVELRTATDPYQSVPGTIETNPNSQWSNRDGRSQNVDPEYRATVDYKLTSATGANIAGAPFSTQSNTSNEVGTVASIMDRVANAVAAEVKKGQPLLRE